MAQYAGRSGLTVAGFIELLHRTLARGDEVDASLTRLAEAAHGYRIPIASHDDDTPEQRDRMQALHCSICEFPADSATARHAQNQGAAIVLGSPNILRGGSHCGRLSTAHAVADGLCDVLTSDYYYPSLLHSVFQLIGDDIATLPDAWPLVSRNPAEAAGLDDRGVLAPGLRADIIIVDAGDPTLPQVVASFVAGRLVYAAREFHL
jgi:alpha-D-ribose 1-methylphosphonate 5-triphosphate diphosphatase